MKQLVLMTLFWMQDQLMKVLEEGSKAFDELPEEVER